MSAVPASDGCETFKSADIQKQKAQELYSSPVPRFKAFALPDIVERATPDPRR